MEKTFLELIETLERNLEKCPWLKEQTLDSLKDEPLSEAVELKQAIENKDIENIKEEIGDLIYDGLLMATVAERDGIITRKEIMKKVSDKIRRRKPWLFGPGEVNTPEEANRIWKEAKEKEKRKD